MKENVLPSVKIKIDKQTELSILMKKYVSEQGMIDITSFRVENPTEYALLPHYFGTVNNAIESNGWVKVVKTKGVQAPRMNLRDQLALYALSELRKKETFEQIGEKFGGVSRAAVSQLYKVLAAEAGKEKLEIANIEANASNNESNKSE
jgi:DNA-binding transcriptional ArsR family regulator